MSEDKKWDDAIREKLNDYTSDTPNDWESLRDQFYATDMDASFDERIKDAIQAKEVPYDPNHWLQLRDELRLRQRVHRKIVQAKVLELVFAILLVQGLFIFTDASLVTPEKVYYADFDSPLSEKAIQIAKSNDDEPITSVATVPSQIFSERKKKEAVVNTPRERTTSIIDHTSQESSIHTTRIIGETPKLSSKLQLLSTAMFKLDETELSDVSTLPMLPIYLENTRDISSAPLRNKRNESLDVYVGRDRLYVRSPEDKIYQLGAYHHEGEAWRLGMMYTRHHESFSVGGGMEYYNYVYSPRPVKERFSTRGFTHRALEKVQASLTNISYNMFAFPLEAALKMPFNKRSGLMLGLECIPTFNMVSNYTVTYSNENDRVIASFSVDNQSQEIPTNLKKKEFVAGILQGGDISQNAFLYGGLSLSYNYAMFDRVGLHAKTSYRAPILGGGLGPNDDRISMLGVSLGLNYRF